MTFLLELRDAARTCPDILQRKLLKDAADDVSNAILALGLEPTAERMQTLNGLWVRAQRMLDAAKRPPDDSHTGGRLKEPARLAA